MKKYKVTLCLMNIEADSEDEAEQKFWDRAIEDKDWLELDVEES